VLVFFDNPYQLHEAGDTTRAIIGGATAILGVASIAAASAALVLRYWRGTADVRQQLKLIAVATTVIFIVITFGTATPDHPLTTLADGLAFSLVPVAIGLGHPQVPASMTSTYSRASPHAAEAAPTTHQSDRSCALSSSAVVGANALCASTMCALNSTAARNGTMKCPRGSSFATGLSTSESPA
jgi:hypothetical protein